MIFTASCLSYPQTPDDIAVYFVPAYGEQVENNFTPNTAMVRGTTPNHSSLSQPMNTKWDALTPKRTAFLQQAMCAILKNRRAASKMTCKSLEHHSMSSLQDAHERSICGRLGDWSDIYPTFPTSGASSLYTLSTQPLTTTLFTVFVQPYESMAPQNSAARKRQIKTQTGRKTKSIATTENRGVSENKPHDEREMEPEWAEQSDDHNEIEANNNDDEMMDAVQ
ncbi:hypothetical protein K504DRAFT_534742 [Pleomassaria siparia CBS 279.74]|uniref:Uncharacterized protein n=1 Tax=Pleomassaria siparia CBS 279.74 TaxID=1314801 RepID=A0A6G1K5A9_9PLEO|nr:hypothetical protein K504DRAFT_534742 [Pleomassaria siparia CBS 279.74]